jgi:hypothetical protein
VEPLHCSVNGKEPPTAKHRVLDAHATARRAPVGWARGLGLAITDQAGLAPAGNEPVAATKAITEKTAASLRPRRPHDRRLS